MKKISLMLSLFALGCGSKKESQGLSGDGGLRSDAHPTIACENQEIAELSTPDEIAGFMNDLNELPFQHLGPYVGEVLNVSKTYVWQATAEVPALGVLAPQDCIDAEDCRHEVTFRIREPIAGVTCFEPDDPEASQISDSLCKKIQIDQASVRFRAVLRDTHPGKYNFVPIIDVLPPCQSSCDAPPQSCESQCELGCDERSTLCPETGECWGSYDEYCRLCLGKSAEECVCQTPAGPKADGEACEVQQSGDTCFGRTCQDGLCVGDE